VVVNELQEDYIQVTFPLRMYNYDWKNNYF